MTNIIPPNVPYKGLIPYEEDDAQFFFGREREREIITANLISSRFTLLYGASGVGKTSVLCAGVEHHLRQFIRNNLEKNSTPEFVVVVFNSWHDDPLRSLTLNIQNTIKETLNVQPFEHISPNLFVDNLLAFTKRIDGDLLIILDQFEEYFLYHGQEDGEGKFAMEFPRAVSRSDLRVNFLVSIREDALAKLDIFEGRIRNLFNNYLRIEHLDREAAIVAIEKPIEQYNRLYAKDGQQIKIGPGLVDAVLKEVDSVGEEGRSFGMGETRQAPTDMRIEPPYLQVVMTRLWEEEMRANSLVLRQETLDDLGGAKRIFQTHLDSSMDALSLSEQHVAERIFYHLVTPSGTKIAQKAVDLAYHVKMPQEKLLPMLYKLSDQNRILRSVPPPLKQPQEPWFEIFHDVLARAILDWRRRYVEKRHKRRLISVCFLALVAGILIMLVFQHFNDARIQKKIAFSRELAANAISNLTVDPELSLLLAIESAKINPTREGEDALRKAIAVSSIRKILRGHARQVTSVAYSSDGTNLITASWDMTARIWDLTTGRERKLLRGHIAGVVKATFSPNGKKIVTASFDSTARIWDAETGSEMAVLRGHLDCVVSAIFTPNGKQIVTASFDKTARVWDTATGRLLVVSRPHGDPVIEVACSPDGKYIVTASDTTAYIWDAEMKQQLAVLRGHRGPVNSVAYSPDGKRIITASNDKTAFIWDAITKRKMITLRGHALGVWSAAFSPDNKRVVTSSEDVTVRIWDAVDGIEHKRIELNLLRENKKGVWYATYSPDGKQIVTANSDATIYILNAVSAGEETMMLGHPSSVWSASFSPDGKQIITACADSAVRVWDFSMENTVPAFHKHENAVNYASYSPDGKQIVTAEYTVARVWDISNWHQQLLLQGHTNTIWSVAYNWDGTRIVTASSDSTGRIWDAMSGRELVVLRGHKERVNAAAYSPDGNKIVTASFDSTARVWNAMNGHELVILRGHTGRVWSANYSSNGKRIATASSDTTVRIWDATNGRQLAIWRGHNDQVWSAAFSPDGKEIVTTSSDKTVCIWNFKTGRKLSILRGHINWIWGATYSPDGSKIITAGADGTARVYLTRIEDLIEQARACVPRSLTAEEHQRYFHSEDQKYVY